MSAFRKWNVYVHGILVDTVECPIESSYEEVIDHLVIDHGYERHGLDAEMRIGR